MQRNRYSEEFKEQALSKARQRGLRTLECVATELNLPLGSLKSWLKTSNQKALASGTLVNLPQDRAAAHYSPAQRLQALLESHTLSGSDLSAWCREKGLFEHQLKQWREAFCNTTELDPRQSFTELRTLKVKNEQLQRDLQRKDRALAEAAALLVLQKKFQALVQDLDT